MSRRRVLSRTAAALTSSAGVLLAIASGSPAAATPDARAVPLHVLITVSTNLPPVSRQVLTTEAGRIWGSEGVDIKWSVPGLASDSSDAPLRVMVVARSTPVVRSPRHWPVAELMPEATPRALAIASITSAQRVVDEASRMALLDPRPPEEYRLGLVLGRAVAHEIGHFLLATATHADNGLMRATVDAQEFAAVGGATFTLDREASRWIKSRLASTRPAATASRAEGFSYRPS